MTIATPTARSLAALGHDARLGIYRLLVKSGGSGLTVGYLGAHMGLPASTLAHHMRTLVDAGLVIQTKQGREIMNHADYDQMNHIVDFLTSECCLGVSSTQHSNA